MSQKCKKWLKMAVFCVKLCEPVYPPRKKVGFIILAKISQKLRCVGQMKGKPLVYKPDPVKLCLLFCLHFFGDMKVYFLGDIRVCMTEPAAYGFQRVSRFCQQACVSMPEDMGV